MRERNHKTYQLAGNEGSLPGSSSLSPGTVEQMCDASHGLLDSTVPHDALGAFPTCVMPQSLCALCAFPTCVMPQSLRTLGAFPTCVMPQSLRACISIVLEVVSHGKKVPAYSGSENMIPVALARKNNFFPNRVDSQLSDTDSLLFDLFATV